MTTRTFYVQCYTGNPTHVMEVIPGSELEDKCKTRATNGYIDALPLGPDDCPYCVEDRRERERHNENMCIDSGCPFMSLSDDEDKCAQRCQATVAAEAIEDSPYQDQLRGLGPVNAS